MTVYIVACRILKTMSADDVTDTLAIALQASTRLHAYDGCGCALITGRPASPRICPTGSTSAGFGTREGSYHPMTQGKIERWHPSLEGRLLLENQYLPGDLERVIADVVEQHDRRRHRENLNCLTPADVYFEQGDRIRTRREEIKRRPIEQYRRQHAA